MTDLPEYVEFGLRSSYPGPFRCRAGDMRMIVLDGDRARIESLVERTLTVPAPGDVAYRPLSGKVMLIYGLNVVSSATPPYDGYGKVDEYLASFFVPVLRGRERDGRFDADGLCMYVPHLIVDNPMSLVAGRETYGFTKALGRFHWSGDDLRIDGYGGAWTPDSTAGWLPLLEMKRAGGAEDADEEQELDGWAGLLDAAAGRLAEPGTEGIIADACRSFRDGRMTMVFLKQFRDGERQDRACYQAVVEAVSDTVHVEPRASLRDWDVTVHPIDSHPLGEELGIRSGRAGWSATLKRFAFDVHPAHPVGP